MLIRHEINRKGHAFLPAYLPDGRTDEIVCLIGAVMSLGSGGPVHQLRPISVEDSTPNTYSGMHGYGPFPFHTDLAHKRYPPRYLLLRCITGFEAVPTLLIDGVSAVEYIGQTVLARALVRPRRPVDSSISLLRLFDRHEGNQGLLRWDEVFVRPASPAGEIGVQQLKEYLSRAKPMSIALAGRGDSPNLQHFVQRLIVPERLYLRLAF